MTGATPAITAKLAAHYQCVPINNADESLILAMVREPDWETHDEMRAVLQSDFTVHRVSDSEFQVAMQACYGIGGETLEALAGAAPEKVLAVDSQDVSLDTEASVAKLVQQMLLEASARRATDIHLQPDADQLRVRYRVDGVLYEAQLAESLKRFQSAVTSRIKIMADLSISEKRLPQDGRMKLRVEGYDLDLRVSTLPTPFGESIGIRFLTQQQDLDLPHLGFADKDLSVLESYLAKPHGIVLLTGPTGSGKTTTLYAFLKKLNRTATNILTLEDPIEYQMKGITQVQVQPKIGLTFAQGLRAMLRHDPDAMMVGEIRDLETAEIAIRVALTGHLVFSTLHTNDAPGAVTRLEDIGVEPYLIASSVVGVIAQRLVRVICEFCKGTVPTPPGLALEFGVAPTAMPLSLWRGAGCERCHHTGYFGRTVLYEIFPVTDAAQALISQRSPSGVLRRDAVSQGMRSLRRCGWEKVCTGITTPEEVLRATPHEEASR